MLDNRTWTLAASDQTTDPLDVSQSVAGIIGFQGGGTCNVVLRAEATIDGTNWVTILLCEGNTVTSATSITISGAPVYKLFRVDMSGYAQIRIYATTVTSGSCVVRAFTSIG
jgi:hypothetical protein